MKIIVTHGSCDLDGITSIWLLKRFYQGWADADLAFIPAGQKLKGDYTNEGEAVENVNGNRVIHVDTGMGFLDHHQTQSDRVSAASLTFDFIKNSIQDKDLREGNKFKAIERIVKYVVGIDHFKQVFQPDAASDYHDLSLDGIMEGLEFEYPKDDKKRVEIGMIVLDAVLHNLENKIWAENEIKEKGIQFTTKWGKGIGMETINDSVLKLAQRMGYVVAVKKDPFHGSVRIKTLPARAEEKMPIDLTPVYQIFKKKDPEASWFLHVSKRMLLNGSSKNAGMRGSKLTLGEVIEILQNLSL